VHHPDWPLEASSSLSTPSVSGGNSELWNYGDRREEDDENDEPSCAHPGLERRHGAGAKEAFDRLVSPASVRRRQGAPPLRNSGPERITQGVHKIDVLLCADLPDHLESSQEQQRNDETYESAAEERAFTSDERNGQGSGAHEHAQVRDRSKAPELARRLSELRLLVA